MAAFLASRRVQGKAGSKKGPGSTQPAPVAKQKSSVVLKAPAARPEAASAQSTQRSAPGGSYTSCRGLCTAQASARTANGNASSPSHTGEYSKDRLKELQQKTARLPASKPAAPADPAPFKISGSFKPAGTPKDDRFLVRQSCRCDCELAATSMHGHSVLGYEWKLRRSCQDCHGNALRDPLLMRSGSLRGPVEALGA